MFRQINIPYKVYKVIESGRKLMTVVVNVYFIIIEWEIIFKNNT